MLARISQRMVTRRIVNPSHVRLSSATQMARLSISARRAFPQDDTDAVEDSRSLSEVLKDELAHEEQDLTESYEGDHTKLTKEIQQYLKKNDWKLQNDVGSPFVYLSKTVDNQDIKVKVNCYVSYNADEEEDVSAVDEDQDEEFESEDYSEVQMTIDLTKKNTNGLMRFEVTLNDSQDYFLNDIKFYADKKIADNTAEEEKTYLGPDYNELDFDVQDKFALHLSDLGFDKELAEIVLDLAFWKNDNEYYSWLENVSAWVAEK
ncbi:hypothetical protein MIR68_007734 [Amoeboaphelidium protococcarum]|nr:hypothetical protein MIR68_007734 [Amoeboaphelidium protococcarum]